MIEPPGRIEGWMEGQPEQSARTGMQQPGNSLLPPDDGTPLPDDLLLRILRLASPRRERDSDLELVCRRWSHLVRASYTRARLLRLSAGAGAGVALRELLAYRSVTHVQLGSGGGGGVEPLAGEGEGAELLRLLTVGWFPRLTSFDLSIIRCGWLPDDGLARFLSKRCGVRSLRLCFFWRPADKVEKVPSWVERARRNERLTRTEQLARETEQLASQTLSSWLCVHARLQDLDLGGLDRLEHLTLDYRHMCGVPLDYRRLHGVPPSAGDGKRQRDAWVPVSRTLDARGQRVPPALRKLQIELGHLFGAHDLPRWLGELPQFSCLTMRHVSEGSLLASLTTLRTLQELHLFNHNEGFDGDELAALASLPLLRKLRLHFTRSPVPKLARAWLGLEELAIWLGGKRDPATLQIPPKLFALTPSLRSLSLWSLSALTWPVLAGLARLTSLTLGCESAPDPQLTAGGLPHVPGFEQGLAAGELAGLPALRTLELKSCRLLTRVDGLYGLGDATAVTLYCQCGSRSCPPIRSQVAYVQAGCQRLTHDEAGRLFRC